MNKIGFATVIGSGLVAAVLGFAAPAQASVADNAPTVTPSAIGAPTGVDRLDWLDKIQPKANPPQVDNTVRHSGR
jgi:hypothetical protein